MAAYFVLWSIEHQMWWRPGRCGYTPERSEAGIYSEAEVREILARANLMKVNEAAIPIACVDLVTRGVTFAVRPAPESEQYAALVALAKAAVARGSGHECEEWMREGTCELCGAREH